MGPFHADSPESVREDVIAKDGLGSTDRERAARVGLLLSCSLGDHKEKIFPATTRWC